MVGDQRHTLDALNPENRPGTDFTEGCVGPRAGLDGCEGSRPHRHEIRRPSTP